MKRFVKCFFELLTQIIVKVRKCKAQRVCVLHFQLAGSGLLMQLMREQRMPLIDERYHDCGLLIFDREQQDVHAGGSGCGCSAAVLNGYFLPKLQSGELGRIIFMATGALMSVTSSQQGETIPGIAHAVVLESPKL